MSQKATILRMLEASPGGVSSGAIYAEHIGRPAARIEDLQKEGVPVEAIGRDPEDPKFVIYALVGSTAEGGGAESPSEPDVLTPVSVSGASSETAYDAPQFGDQGCAGEPRTPRSTPSMFDHDQDYKAA